VWGVLLGLQAVGDAGGTACSGCTSECLRAACRRKLKLYDGEESVHRSGDDMDSGNEQLQGCRSRYKDSNDGGSNDEYGFGCGRSSSGVPECSVMLVGQMAGLWVVKRRANSCIVCRRDPTVFWLRRDSKQSNSRLQFRLQ
jgi:hypothetical protein